MGRSQLGRLLRVMHNQREFAKQPLWQICEFQPNGSEQAAHWACLVARLGEAVHRERLLGVVAAADDRGCGDGVYCLAISTGYLYVD